jgi:hypothetical protein
MAVTAWAYVWIFYSVPLVFMSVSVPVLLLPSLNIYPDSLFFGAIVNGIVFLISFYPFIVYT